VRKFLKIHYKEKNLYI
jgi:phenylalanyl-tRNA synthetase alpha subunit